MTDEELEAIESRARAATPGPWDPCMDEDHCSAVTANGFVISLAVTRGTIHANARKREDGVFIAAAREDVPALIAEVRRLRAETEALKASANDRPDVWRLRNPAKTDA